MTEAPEGLNDWGPQVSPAYGGCRCPCHSMPGLIHAVPCCTKSSEDDEIESLWDKAPLSDEAVADRQYDALMTLWNKTGELARKRFIDQLDTPVMDARYSA